MTRTFGAPPHAGCGLDLSRCPPGVRLRVFLVRIVAAAVTIIAVYVIARTMYALPWEADALIAAGTAVLWCRCSRIESTGGDPPGIESTICVRSAEVDAGTTQRIRLGLPKHLARHRRHVTLAEGEKFQQVHNGIPFRPPEIRVGNFAGLVAYLQQERGQSVGHGGADASQHVVAADGHARHNIAQEATASAVS